MFRYHLLGMFQLSAKAAFSGRCGSLQITFQLAAIEAQSIMGWAS